MTLSKRSNEDIVFNFHRVQLCNKWVVSLVNNSANSLERSKVIKQIQSRKIRDQKDQRKDILGMCSLVS